MQACHDCRYKDIRLDGENFFCPPLVRRKIYRSAPATDLTCSLSHRHEDDAWERSCHSW